MKLATYNIRKGGSPRVHWVKMVENHSTDLLLVQESYAPDEHLPPLLYPDARGNCVWEAIGRCGWGSALYSSSGTVKPVGVPGFSGWVVGAEIESASWLAREGDSILAFSLHAPSRKVRYSKEVNNVLDAIKQIAAGQKFIVGGDFNLTISNSPASERPVSNQDLAIQARLAEEFGLINCWQEANPQQPLHQTLRWTGAPDTPYHCDGLFVPKSWKDRLQSCSVLAGDEWNRLSDHNPVAACFS